MSYGMIIGAIISSAASMYAADEAAEGAEGAAAAQLAQFKAGLNYLMETERAPQHYRSEATKALGEMYGLPAPIDLGLGGGGYVDAYGNPITPGTVGQDFTVESHPGQVVYREQTDSFGDPVLDAAGNPVVAPVPETYGGDEINYGFTPAPDTLNISPGGVNATPTDRALAQTQYDEQTSRAREGQLPDSVDYGQEATFVTPGEARVEDYFRSLSAVDDARYSELSGLPNRSLDIDGTTYGLTPGGRQSQYDLLLSQVTQSGRPKMRPEVMRDGQRVMLADELMELDVNPVTGQPWGSNLEVSGVSPIPVEHFKNYETYVSRTKSIPEAQRPSYQDWHMQVFGEAPTSPEPALNDRPAGYGGSGPSLTPDEWLGQNVAEGSWLDARLNQNYSRPDALTSYPQDYVDPGYSTGFTAAPGSPTASMPPPTTLSGIVAPGQEQAMLPKQDATYAAPTAKPYQPAPQTNPYGVPDNVYNTPGFRPSGMPIQTPPATYNDVGYAGAPTMTPPPPTQQTTLSGIQATAPSTYGQQPMQDPNMYASRRGADYNPSSGESFQVTGGATVGGHSPTNPPSGPLAGADAPMQGEFIPAGDGMSYYDRYKQGPLYGAMMGGLQSGEEAILRNAAMTGGLRSGNTQDALARLSSDLESQATMQYLSGLSSLAQLPTNATAIAGQYGQMGETQAGGMLGAARAKQAGLGQAGTAWSNYFANQDW